MAQAQYHSLHEMLTVGAPRTAASAAPLAIALLRGPLLQLALLLPDASAGRRAVGVVTERYSEGIMTWDDDLEERGAATLQVAGMLGIECGSTIVGQTECALDANENIFSAAFGIPVAEHPMQHATLCSVYLSTMNDFEDMNVVYEEFWRRQGIETPPARVALAGSGLPADALIEVQCTGHYDGDWAVAGTTNTAGAAGAAAGSGTRPAPPARPSGGAGGAGGGSEGAELAELRATVAAQSARLAKLEKLLGLATDGSSA